MEWRIGLFISHDQVTMYCLQESCCEIEYRGREGGKERWEGWRRGEGGRRERDGRTRRIGGRRRVGIKSVTQISMNVIQL